jgi:hypothetical protein
MSSKMEKDGHLELVYVGDESSLRAFAKGMNSSEVQGEGVDQRETDTRNASHYDVIVQSSWHTRASISGFCPQQVVRERE